uniref:Uncharacterized protein n=1 Tax=Globisporangium ultimum (strain ATCC 200006 / CBS 805.95 / DAOM BR144) TaxID=431595 RepID=K3W794_GLOUD
MLLGMRHVLKLTRHHPWALSAALVLISTMYTYARVLVLQFCLGALQHWIHRYPTNFPHGFFIPFYYISTTLAFFAAIAHDCLVLQSGLWKYVLPIPLTTNGRLYRVFGVPLYAFGIATIEAVQLFRNPNMESDLSRLAVYFRGLPEYAWLDDMKLRKLVTDIKWHAWSLQTTTSPTTAAYIRLPLELLLALVVCSVYGIAVFCKEPRHDGEELRDATINNDRPRVKNILLRGVNPNSRSDDGSTSLHICAQQALVGPAKELLEHKADPNVCDRLGFTALHWAVQLRREEQSPTNRLDMIRLLLRHGADPRKADPSGVTPLSIASKKENESSLEVLQEVLAAEASVDSGSSNRTSTSIDN